MDRAVTARKPTSDATFERVAVGAFFLRFVGGSASTSPSTTDDGDVNINLNA